MTTTKQRILQISKEHNLSHLGSCLTSVDIIEEIYKKKARDEKFILSNGHAGLALYVILEKYELLDAEYLLRAHGVHPNYNPEHKIHCSTGSLGQGLPIALGMALSDRSKDVYCLISDGECAEGSIWEALRIKSELMVDNLKIYININGYSAYDQINVKYLVRRLYAFDPTIEVRITDCNQYSFLQGIDAHYCTVPKDYKP